MGGNLVSLLWGMGEDFEGGGGTFAAVLVVISEVLFQLPSAFLTHKISVTETSTYG